MRKLRSVYASTPAQRAQISRSGMRNPTTVKSLSDYENACLDMLKAIHKAGALNMHEAPRAMVSKLINDGLVATETRNEYRAISYLRLTSKGGQLIGVKIIDPIMKKS